MTAGPGGMNPITWIFFIFSVHPAHSLLNLVNGLLQTAGANLARLNPCPYQNTPTYRPRSSFDIACLEHQKQAYKQPATRATLPNTNHPRAVATVAFTLPQALQQTPVVRDTKDTERAVLVAEMQEILDKVMRKMEREVHHRPLHGDGLFKYEGDEHGQKYANLGQDEDQVTFSQLMKMDKGSNIKTLLIL
jgi:hypothetical protein